MDTSVGRDTFEGFKPGKIYLLSKCYSSFSEVPNLPLVKVRCPRCGMGATEIQAFLFQRRVAYCENCGWNRAQATAKLRGQMLSTWLLVGIGVLFASIAWLRGPYGLSGAAMIAVPFVLLPLISGVVTKYRLSTLLGAGPRTARAVIHEANSTSAEPALAGPENNPSVLMRPRTVRLVPRGYLYIAGVAVVSAFLVWVLAFFLRGIAGSSNTTTGKLIVAVLLYSGLLWQCFSFFRNRVREKQLFADGVRSRAGLESI